ncbi:MAG: radical SAM protein [Phycisphaerae bacterium]
MTVSHPTPTHPGRPDAAPPMRLLFWESTVRCNLACRHCRRLDVAEELAESDLTTEQVFGIVDSLVELGRPIFVFSGGEPLMRDDWERTAAYARRREVPTALATNGTLIDEATAQRISDAGFRRVSISLDGADPATHDAFRGLPGAFEQACRGIRLLRNVDVPVQINATIAAHNDSQLDDLYTLAKSLDVIALHLFLLVPVGCGTQLTESHQLGPERYERVLNWICDRRLAGSDIEIKPTCAPHYYRVAAERGLPAARGRGCLCGLSVAFVSHQGRIFPCGYLPVEAGRVPDQPLQQIWRESEVFAALRDFDRLGGKCGRCEYKTICGGCRARALAQTGDYLSEEPACTHRPTRQKSK